MLTLVTTLLLFHQPLQPIAVGIASYYTVASSGPVTASGEPMRDHELTCAMRRIPLGTHILVVADNGNSVVCRVNDRGPYIKRRVIDLSLSAMRKLHPKAGLIRVRVYRHSATNSVTNS